MIPPLQRGEFVRLTWGNDQQARGMVTLASPNGRSIIVMGEFMIEGFVGTVPLSERLDSTGPTGQFNTLTGDPVIVERELPETVQ